MTTGGGSRPRTIIDVSAPLEHYLVRVPFGGEGVCAVCHSAVYDGYRVCFPCNQARTELGDLRLDAVSFVSLAPAGEQLARDLYTYKRSTVPAQLRLARTLGLAAVLWRWLALHEQCIAHAAGSRGFDMIATIPSASGRAEEHPLTVLVGGVVENTEQRLHHVLSPGTPHAQAHEHSAERFSTTGDVDGADVLLVDDTWTTGSNMQSASAALKHAGARRVAGVAIGRWFKTDWKDNSAWLKEHRRPGWSWDTCCLEARP